MITVENLVSFDFVKSSLCGAMAAEKALRSFNSSHSADSLSESLAGTFFYSLCAARVIPYANTIGTIILLFESFLTHRDPNAHLTARVIGNSLATIGTQVVAPIAEHLHQNVIAPVARNLSKACSAILSCVHLPMNPAWYASAALLTTAIVYRGLFLKTPSLPPFNK